MFWQHETLRANLMIFVLVFVCELNAASETFEDILRKATIVAGNIQTAITAHLTEDQDYQVTKQFPEDRRNPPSVLVKKDGSFTFDWTPGQQARNLMEELRQGIHALQSVERARGLDAIALAGAREYWPRLRDLSCRESPGIRYYDLDGFAQFCPEQPPSKH
jgi:hypothetical protein